uniref:Uncharacterized protein n=1 Tax=Noccaea caerulescens TaxID=107243 RepID=A0A1J3K6Z2_NOCCA
MAERKLNFDSPLLSARRMKKEAVSVRRNIAKKKLPDDDDDSNKTSESLSVVPLKCPLEKAMIDGDLTRQQVEEESEDDDDDVFSDALDTLSLKHSISGNAEETQPPMPMPSEEDPQCRDFMMNRFLPAAKSMQQPQYALKRQPVRQIRDIVPAENLATPKRYESITTPPSYYHGTCDDEESEDDDDDDEDDEYLSKRGCGMMSPQVCFKNSIGMLLKDKPNSQVKSSKVSQLKSRFQSVKKLALDSIYKQKPIVGNKFEQYESSLSMPSSPYRQTSCMSPYRSVGNSSPLHPSGFPGTRKEAEIMRANRLNKHIRKSQDLLYPKSIRSQESSTSSVMEKTLYVVDTENNSPEANSSLPETMETISEEPKAILLQLQESVEPALSTSGGIKKMEADDGFGKNNSSGSDLSPQLAPPPPKTPSDSWLFRNLPSRSYLFYPPKTNIEQHSTSVTKWETIVKKTSYMHRDHIRYSQVSNLKT